MVHSLRGMRSAGAWSALILGAMALSACAVDTGDEDVESDAEEITSGRCGGTSVTRTVRVKVMTINLRNDSDEWKRRFPLIAAEIDRLEPDIIGLQEIEIADDAAEHLNDLLAARGHAKYNLFQKRKPGIRGFFTGEGVGIMSRWPIVEKHHEDLPEMRVSVLARIKHPSGGFIDMTNTHLHHMGGAEADGIRLEEAKQTIDLVDRNDDCWPTFLTGDMNTTESSQALKQFVSAGFVDSYRKVHGAETATTGNTSPIVLREGAFTQNPRKRIDFVYGRSAGGRTVKPVESVVGLRNHDGKGFYPSDHLGVMTTFDVKL